MVRLKTNQNLVTRTISLILIGLFFPWISYAQVVPSHSSEQEDEAERNWEQIFIEDNIRISRWFDSVADALDLFLVGRRVTDKRNESSIRIENSTFSSEGEKASNSTSLSIIPRFPNFEEYWQLKFTTYDDQQDRRNAQSNYLRQTPRERNVGASVGLARKLGNVRTTFQPRIQLQNPLNVSHSLAFESIADNKSFQINPKLEFYANPTDGVGTFQALNFNWYLTTRYTFTFINQGNYREKLNKYETTNGFVLSQSITQRMGMSYSLLFNAHNRPGYHLEGYSLAVGWSHMLYRRILDYQLIPHLDFLREKRFKGVAGLTLNINLNF